MSIFTTTKTIRKYDGEHQVTVPRYGMVIASLIVLVMLVTLINIPTP